LTDYQAWGGGQLGIDAKKQKKKQGRRKGVFGSASSHGGEDQKTVRFQKKGRKINSLLLVKTWVGAIQEENSSG